MSLEIIQSAFEDIRECIERIIQWSSEIKKPEDLTLDPKGTMTLDAISMRLQVIGEMLKNVDKRDKEFLKKYPGIEWAEIMKMRDIISHHYLEVNAEVIYKICKNDIPQLEKAVNQILSDIDKQTTNN